MTNEEVEKYLEKQKEISKKEAAKFDKERFDSDAGLTEEETEKIQKRAASRKKFEDNAPKDRLNAIKDFDNDPIGFLKEKLAAGNYEGRDRQHNYLLLVTMVQIQNSLKELVTVLKSRK